jgi:hypothetical protein
VAVAPEYKDRYEALLLYHLFTIIHANFLVKSAGGADSLGNRWKPLSQKTKIYKPLVRGEKRQFGIRSYSGSIGILTPGLSNLWKGIFKSLIARGKSPGVASRIAWGIVKSRGGKTKKEVLANREVPILITTRRLERSLRPGKVVRDKYIPSEEQIAFISRGKVTVGTKVPYAAEVSEARPAIPFNIDPWIREAGIKAATQIQMEIKAKR